ncbi:MAG: response regulator [Gammaproteobacteria bacterium]|nr:response regulator [Gammaproteobacteria bacterium]
MNKNKILIIDNSDVARTLLFKKLKATQENIEIIACGSAKEALSAVTRYKFDIITTGLDLQDMNGYELIKKIRKSPKNSDTAIFVVSSTRIDDDMGQDPPDDDDTKAVTAYFDKTEGHKTLISFISNFLQKSDIYSARILYIDYGSVSAAITSTILKTHGFHFKHFKTAEKALEFIRKDVEAHGACSYDLLITDMLLSDTIIGYNLVKKIREDFQLDSLTFPALILTPEPGDNEKTDFGGIFAAGANDFIRKPITEDTLLERIKNLINIKRQNEALRH